MKENGRGGIEDKFKAEVVSDAVNCNFMCNFIAEKNMNDISNHIGIKNLTTQWISKLTVAMRAIKSKYFIN